MSEMGGLIEFALVAMFALGWAILEWQGRRLDRKRAERDAADTFSKKSKTTPCKDG